MTSIVLFSDMHGQYSKKLTQWFMDNPADILLFAGDLQMNSYDDGTKFLEWLNSLPYTHKICIFGNHDSNWEDVMQQVIKYDNLTFLNHDSITVNGIKIFGSPYSLPFREWWFMKTEQELRELYRQIPDDVNILITHGSAFGILDEAVDGRSTGSISLAKRITELKKLKYHISGHIHENFGKLKVGRVTHINASILDERYRVVNDPVVINYRQPLTGGQKYGMLDHKGE